MGSNSNSHDLIIHGPDLTSDPQGASETENVLMIRLQRLNCMLVMQMPPTRRCLRRRDVCSGAGAEWFGLNYVVFRTRNVYGEFENIGDRYRNVIGIFMNQIMQGKPLTIFGGGEQTRAVIFVGRFAEIIAWFPKLSDA